jgi:hypothetical protein
MRHHQMTSRVVACLAATMVLVGAGALMFAAQAAGPTLTVKGANFNPRFGPDGVVLHECPLTVTYAGGTSSGTVTVDVVTVAPIQPTGMSVMAGGPKTVHLDASGGGTVAVSAADFNFTGVTSNPDPNSDLFKIQVIVNPGGTALTFWVADCDQAGTPPTVQTTTTTTTTAPPTTTATTVAPTSITSAPTTVKVPTQVLAQTITANGVPAQALATQAVTAPTLAKTGSHTGVLLMLAIWLLVAGAAVTLFSKLGRAAR